MILQSPVMIVPEIYLPGITIAFADAIHSIIYREKIMSTFEKTEKIFGATFCGTKPKSRKAHFTRGSGQFSRFVKKIEIFQKNACNYEKGMVLFNSSLREIQNSEKRITNMAPWSSG